MRYFIELSYKGTNYHGWQIQPNSRTVQGVLNYWLSRILNFKVEVMGSSRTDSGVHAAQQYAHFNVSKELLDCEKLLYSLNSVLPNDIVVYSIFSVSEEMHARYSAISRTYQYSIVNRRDPFSNEITYFSNKNFDLFLMNEAASLLSCGPLDCKIFSKTNSGNDNYVCNIIYAHWHKSENGITFEIMSNRFLRGMVRIIVAYLLQIGEKKITIFDFKEIILNKSLVAQPPLASEKGLCLVKVCY